MATSSSRAVGTAVSLRALARLLDYPGAELRANLDAIRAGLRAEAALDPRRLAELDALVENLQRQDPLDAEADYVQLFDGSRRAALHLFEHVHGESRERGPALIDLARMYEQAGLFLAPGVMPDHLPVVLEFASTQPAAVAAAFLGEFAHLLNLVFNALEQRNSLYAAAFGALLDLAGEPSRRVELPAEPPLDERWEEPAVFDGCTGSRPTPAGHEAPVRVVRPAAPPSCGAQR